MRRLGNAAGASYPKKETECPSQFDQKPRPNGAACESLGNRVPLSWQGSVGAARTPRFRLHVLTFHALKGHRIAAMGATLGIHPEKENRVLKERRIVSVSRTSTPAYPMRCSFRTHLFSRIQSQGWHPGLVCVAPLGQMERSRFRSRVRAPNRDIAFHQVGAAPLGQMGRRRFRSRV